MFGLLIAGCSDNENEEELPAPDVPDYSTIIVKDIQNMPKNFTFDRVEVKVTGLDWQVIETLTDPSVRLPAHWGNAPATRRSLLRVGGYSNEFMEGWKSCKFVCGA